MTEKTLAIIKPDAVQRGLTGVILSMVQESGLTVRAMKMVHVTKEQAERFYAVHRGKHFFADLTEYISSGPIVVAVLEGEGSIAVYRALMGATDPAEADEGTIRRLYGLDVERNSCHGSDSPETAAVEVAFFFSGLELAGEENGSDSDRKDS